MRLQPLHSNLIIRPRVNADTTDTGLLIPDIAKGNMPYRFGTVVDVGTGRVNAEGKTIPLVVKTGDVVAYAKGAGVEFPMDNEVLLLLEEKYVLGIAHDLPVASLLTGIDGRLLKMAPLSRAMPDSAAKNREELERAERMGFSDEVHTDEPNGFTG